jgi:hypothetical protein
MSYSAIHTNIIKLSPFIKMAAKKCKIAGTAKTKSYEKFAVCAAAVSDRVAAATKNFNAKLLVLLFIKNSFFPLLAYPAKPCAGCFLWLR